MNIYMVSLGCAKNRVDSEMILGVCKENNMNVVDDPSEADLLMVNTCGFIESAKEEAIQTILELASYKNNNKKLLVFGCLAQRYKEELIKAIPEVDRFVSIAEYGNISQILNDLLKGDYKIHGSMSALNRLVSTPSYMRYIKISEGCRNRCAFCAIPLIRGTLVSTPIEEVVEDVKNAVNDGVYEINLISQDTTRYGEDLYKKLALVDLLKEIVKINGDFKVRLLYLYPDIVTDELIEFIKNNDKIMPYFDIPIQHTEDLVLKKMYRRGNREFLLNLFKKIKKEIPEAILRTTLMVGFPYETKEDVKNMISFMKEVKFDRLGAFTYSREEGTVGYTYPDIISQDEMNHRYSQIMNVQKRISLENNQKMIGKMVECFIEEYDEESYMYKARNYAYAPDDIDGAIYVAAKSEHNPGDKIKVMILDADEYSLTGEEIE